MPQTQEQQFQTWKKSRNIFIYIILGLFITSMFFAFEFFEKESKWTVISKNQAILDKKENSKELNKIKDYVKENNPEMFAQYIKINNKLKNSKKEYNEAVKNDKFLGFNSFKIFAYQFFPTLLFFFYVIYHFYVNIKRRKNNIGAKLVHFVFILFSIVKLYWIFQSSFDLSKSEYYLYSLISTIAISYAVWLFHLKELNWYKRVKNKLIKVSVYSLHYVEENKKEKMAQIIEEPI